ncbi:hypothetical protein PCP38_00610 [Pseudomonas aeruginosa]|uniref:hypothetical protein n=1 Tax=Pseudomonas aeruginosa TaxID=287 RepID=UPI002AFB16FE|nr:hypothetical protein [Pseudomonas aeruginosa]EMB9982468.1 hypothetical protein [Pseudomonas aeruginosa]MCO1981672.1 hypothetical protein [Pseudomonas aeruginosa]
MKVIFKHKSGREQEMQERFAKTLQALGRGTYMTRDMRPAATARFDLASAAEDIANEQKDIPAENLPEAPRRGRKPKSKPE